MQLQILNGLTKILSVWTIVQSVHITAKDGPSSPQNCNVGQDGCCTYVKDFSGNISPLPNGIKIVIQTYHMNARKRQDFFHPSDVSLNLDETTERAWMVRLDSGHFSNDEREAYITVIVFPDSLPAAVIKACAYADSEATSEPFLWHAFVTDSDAEWP